MIAWLWGMSAWASSTYPGEVETELGMPCTPSCLLCHETSTGGGGTVTQPFGQALEARGLTGGSQGDLLSAALSALEADGVDSNGDGVTDIDALLAGDDPNGGVPFCDQLVPTYGCFDHSPAGLSAWAVAGAAWATRRRRRDATRGRLA